MMSSRVMPRVTPRASRVSAAPRGRVLSRFAPTVRDARRARVGSGPPVRAVAFRDPADAAKAKASTRSDRNTVSDTADVRPSQARPPLEDYPPHRSRLSLALDPYSRMSLPDRNGNGEVQKRPTSDIFWGALCCFVTVSVLGLIDMKVKTMFGLNAPFMSGAWGTISVLAFGTMENPAARTYNCVVATLFSTLAVSLIVQAMGVSWYSRALAMAVSLAFMMQTGSVHPPGAAAIMAFMDQKVLQELGVWYVAYPVLLGSLFVLTMGRVCARLKRKHEFVLLFRWRGFGKKGKNKSAFPGFEKRKGHPVLYRKSAYGFKKPPEFLKELAARDAIPAAVALVDAEASDSGGRSVGDAMNDALRGVSEREMVDASEGASLARIDESGVETHGAVVYSFQ